MGYLQTIRYKPIASTSSFYVASSGCTRKVFENSILWRKICPRRRASAPASRNLPFHTPQPAQNRTGIPSSCGREKRAVRYGGGPHGYVLRLRQLNQPHATAAAQSATRYGGGPHGYVLRRRQPKQPRATAAARTATCCGGNSIIHALRRRQPTQKRGRCQSNGPAQTMRYISLRKRFLISSTLASRGLPGAQASA